MSMETLGGLPKVIVPDNEIPDHYKEAIQKGDVGGAFVVFVTAKNTEVLAEKVEKIKKYCNRVRKQYE